MAKTRAQQIDELISALSMHTHVKVTKTALTNDPTTESGLANEYIYLIQNATDGTREAGLQSIKQKLEGNTWYDINAITQKIKETNVALITLESKEDFATRIAGLTREEFQLHYLLLWNTLSMHSLDNFPSDQLKALDETRIKHKISLPNHQQPPISQQHPTNSPHMEPQPVKSPYKAPDKPPYDFCKIVEPSMDQHQIIKDATGAQLPAYSIKFDQLQTFLQTKKDDKLFNDHLLEEVRKGAQKVFYHGGKKEQGVVEIVGKDGRSSFVFPATGSYTISVINDNPVQGQYEEIKIKDGKPHTPFVNGRETTPEENLDLTIKNLKKIEGRDNSKIDKAWIDKQIEQLQEEQRQLLTKPNVRIARNDEPQPSIRNAIEETNIDQRRRSWSSFEQNRATTGRERSNSI